MKHYLEKRSTTLSMSNSGYNLFISCTPFMVVSILYEVIRKVRLLPYFYQYYEHFNPLRDAVFICFSVFDDLPNYMILLQYEQSWLLHYITIPEQPENNRGCSKTVGKMLPKTLPSTKGQHLLTSNTRREVTYGTRYHLSLGVSSTFSYFRHRSNTRRRENRNSRTLPRYVQALFQWRKRLVMTSRGSVSRAVNTPLTKYPENLLIPPKDVVHE
jgi:hypothetical protein